MPADVRLTYDGCCFNMKVSELAGILKNANISFTVTGDQNEEIAGFSSLSHYKNHTITWMRDCPTVETLSNEEEFSCIVTDASVPYCRRFVAQITVDDPRHAFFTIVGAVWGRKEIAVISAQATVEPGAVIGEDVCVGAYTVVSSASVIGNRCRLGCNVSLIGRVQIGDDTVIQSGAVIGEDGFAHVKAGETLTDIPHYGGVVIGSRVAIGANTCVCRGTIDDTVIGDDAKIDNLCHIAHNAVIGERVQIVAGTTVMGSVHIGRDTWVSTSIIRDQLTVGSSSVVGMGAVVTKNVPDNIIVAGIPAKQWENSHEKF